MTLFFLTDTRLFFVYSLASIRNGINVFEYETSEYMRAFNMQVKTQAPLQVPARVLAPPTLEYGGGGPPKSRAIVSAYFSSRGILLLTKRWTVEAGEWVGLMCCLS